MSGFAVDESRTLARFRRCHNSTADETISPSGFYQRLTQTLAEYLRDHIEDGTDDLVAQMEAESGTDVCKAGVTEAVMAIAEGNPKLVKENSTSWNTAGHEPM